MKRLPLVAMLCVCALWVACAEPTGVTPDGVAAHRSAFSRERLTFLTRNLYVGADLAPVIAALGSPDPADDVPALLAAVGTLPVTAYPVRAGALAAEIDRLRPHAVGLQEVSEIDIDLTALGVPFVTHQNFLAILAESLAVRGRHYVTAAAVRNLVAEPVPGVRLVDFDVLLVDADRVKVRSGAGHTFAANIGVVAPGVEIKRGWVQATVRIAGETYTITSTHMESGDAPGLAELRAQQAAELVAAQPHRGLVVLMGDLNDVPGSPMYRIVRRAGFVDSWADFKHGAPGPTCCQQADLGNSESQLDQRIDYVWVRGQGRHLDGRVELLGERPADRVPGPVHPLWPSDHAGVALTLVVR